MSNNLHPKFVNQILHGDCVQIMGQLPDASIFLTVTSPPYDEMRIYGGHAFDFEAVAQELWRITAVGGVVVWVVQDQVKDGSFTGTKYRQLLYFMGLGFRLHNDLTLEVENAHLPHKVRYVPNSHTAFVLSKGRPRTVRLLRDKRNKTAGVTIPMSHARKKDGTTRTSQNGKPVAQFRHRSDVWNYVGGPATRDKLTHPAMMSERMAEDLILSFSRPGDLVFDPFSGSGTTLKMALLNHRKYCGCEINGPYWAEAVARLQKCEEEYAKRLDEELGLKVVVPPSVELHRKPIKVPTIIVPSKAAVSIKNADVLNALKEMDTAIVDAVMCDPPYALTTIAKRFGKQGSTPPKNGGIDHRIVKGFLGKEWDGALPSVEVWAELLRVAKPGATLLAFGHPRTHHRLMAAIEDAGWEIRDCLSWLYGSGFPKSHDFSRAIDKQSEAAKWLGYGTALKPAWEPVVLAMKAIERSYAANAVEWGVAGLNIDPCRIAAKDKTKFPVGYASGWYGNADRTDDPSPNGRFPANVILDEEAGRLLDLQGPISKGGKRRKSGGRHSRHKGDLLYGGGIGGGPQNAPDTYGDAGGISRFFYCPKASKVERNAGLDGLPIKRPDERQEAAMGIWDKKGIQPQENHHPCVKPLDLCRYLATLILPPERETPRKIIVPYAGSGSEMIGAVQAGWDEIVGIEIDPEHVAIARRRIVHWMKEEAA